MENGKRLIEANALRTQFDDIPPFIGMTGGCVQQFIDKAPTVDAVEVVRCKDCKHRYSPNNTKCKPFCTKQFGMDARDDDFCSYGERKDNG